MRLDKYVSYALDISREDARKLIKNTDIFVNDKLIKNPSFVVDENKDVIKRSTVQLEYQQYIYLMMNKPSGYLSATTDRDKTVIDLIKEYKKFDLSIAGRLDIDSVGLLLITNDGKLIHEVTSPKSNIYKKYYVEVDGSFKEEDIVSFSKGLTISDGKGSNFITKEARLDIVSKNSAYISIKEGKFHQIKNMCEKVGLTVTYLKRIEIGSLILDESLGEGEYRNLIDSEIDLLKSLTKTRH